MWAESEPLLMIRPKEVELEPADQLWARQWEVAGIRTSLGVLALEYAHGLASAEEGADDVCAEHGVEEVEGKLFGGCGRSTDSSVLSWTLFSVPSRTSRNVH